MKRRWLGGLIGLIGVATGSYAFSLVAATPEEMIRRPFACPEQAHISASDFQVLAVRNWQHGVVALYRGSCPGTEKRFAPDAKENQAVLSYRVVQRNGMEWQLSSSGNHRVKSTSTAKADKSKLIEYGVGRNLVAKNLQNVSSAQSPRKAANPKNRYAVFFGQVLSPSVSTVEVTFNNGKILRDSATDGLFLLVAPGATGVCDVRVLGVDKQILQRDEIISKAFKTNPDQDPCQPISGQL